MKNKFLLFIPISVIILVVTLTLFIVVGFYLFQKSRINISSITSKTVEEGLTDEQTVNLNVTANNGTFEPNSFTSDLFGTLNLRVSAIDKDYYFRVKDYPRLDTNVIKGKTTTIKVQFLGLGVYTFTCGDGCSGTITIESIQDQEDLK